MTDPDPADEIHAHIADRADDLVRAGMPREEAERQARLEFGSIERYREEAREAGRRGSARLELLGRDVMLAARRLRAAPGFTIFAAISLALGIGVTTSVHAVIASILWRPLPWPDPDRLVVVTRTAEGRPAWQSILSRGDFADLRSVGGPWARAEATATFGQALVDQERGLSELVRGEAVTGGYFQAIGLRPSAGRLLHPADDDPSAPAVVVLGHTLWTTTLGSDSSVIGRTVRLGGHPFEVVGIAPPSFGGLSPEIQERSQAWVSLSNAWRFGGLFARPASDRSTRQLTAVARWPDGLPLEALSQAAAVVGRRLDEALPIDERAAGGAPARRPRLWAAAPIADLAAPPLRGTMLGVFVIALVALLLVVACTNLANLVLARGASRHAELAMRHALGATRPRLVRELCVESALLAALGGLGAAVVVRVLLTWFTTDVPVSSARVMRLEPVLSLPVVGLAAVSLLLALFVFGVGPALQLVRRDLRPSLVADGGRLARHGWRGRQRLVSWQVAISTTLFLVAAFCLRGVFAEARHDSGVDVDRLAIGTLPFYMAPWDEPRAREAVERVLEQVGQLPGVEAVAVSSGTPFGTTMTPFARLDSLESGGPRDIDAMLMAASPDIFRTTGVTLRRGRLFDGRDTAAAPPVAVVSETAARDLFGNADAIGREMRLRGVTTRDRNPHVVTIVGTVSDTDAQFVMHRKFGSVYVPFAQRYEVGLMLIARAADDPADLVGPLGAAVRRADADLVLGHPNTGPMVLTGMYVLIGILARTAAALALLTLGLSMAGLYGVLSQAVAGRTREIGVRVALGAEVGRIRRMVLRDGLKPVGLGVTLGIGLGLAVRAVIHALTPASVSAADVYLFLFVPLPLVVAALLACYLPARRAAHVNPIVALKEN